MNSIAHGAIYTIHPLDKRSLNRVEGLASGYRRSRSSSLSMVVRSTCSPQVADPIDPTLRPYRWYGDLVVRGACSTACPMPIAMKSRMSTPAMVHWTRLRIQSASQRRKPHVPHELTSVRCVPTTWPQPMLR